MLTILGLFLLHIICIMHISYDHWYILLHPYHHFIPTWYDQCIGGYLQGEVINYFHVYNKDVDPSL